MPIRETRRLKYKDKGDSLKFASCAIVCSMYDFDSKKKSQLRSSKLAPNKIKIEIIEKKNKHVAFKKQKKRAVIKILYIGINIKRRVYTL